MSEVSSLFLSRSLERKKGGSARRRLFGTPDPGKLRADLDVQEKKLNDLESNRFMKRWGFNPEAGEPVQGGDCECVLVDPADTTVPLFYRKGFSTYKSRPVPGTRENSPVFFSHRMVGPRVGAKRKLPLDDDHENENVGVQECRVPIKGEYIDVRREPFALSSSAPMPTNFDSDSEFGLNRSSSAASLPELSPAPRIEITPPTRPKSLTQSSIKDYLSCKKHRCIGKALPRT